MPNAEYHVAIAAEHIGQATIDCRAKIEVVGVLLGAYVSLGVSAIGQLGITKGVNLTRDDRLRRWVIGQLICQFRLDRQQFAAAWHEDFDQHFADELARLKPMMADELIADKGRVLQVQPAGRLLIRAICRTFDAYRKEGANQRFSRII